MDRLKRLCDRSMRAMGYVHNFAKTMTQATSVYAIETQLERLESHFKLFNEYELELLAFPDYVPVTEEAENTYVEIKSKLQQALGAHRKPKANEDINTTLEAFIGQQKSFYDGMGSKRVHLPKIQIEPFSGDYNTWPTFNDVYLASIHNDETLSNVHKLQLLKSLVKGDAAALIGHMTVTEGNYLIAWEKLVKRYNKPKQILGSLIQAFLAQNRIIQVNGKELRKLTERSEEVINSIKMLGAQAQERDPWLIYIIISKLDPDTRERWASHTSDIHFPEFSELISFLNNRCDA